jgi:hypothetical protein
MGYNVEGSVGPHHVPGDSLCHWLHWLTTDNPNTLWNPCVGHRRQAEWDDNGEVLPRGHEGPDVRAMVEIPAGVHQVALYFFNKDGHTTTNRHRDYVLQLKRWSADEKDLEQSPILARARVHDFWGGHYKLFAISGPGKFLLQVGRNHSVNTTVSAVLIDRLSGEHEGLNQILYSRPMPWMGDLFYDPPALDAKDAPALWQACENNRGTRGQLISNGMLRVLACRQAASVGSPANLAALRWRAHLWVDGDREEFRTMMARAWEETLKMNPQMCDVSTGKEQ